MNDYKKFEKDKKKVKKIIKKWYGKRCPDYEKGCILCKAWKLFYELIENPFEKDE